MVDVVRARRIVVVAVVAAIVPACQRAPTEQEVAARKAREEAIVQASQEEERRKDRATQAAAAKAAEAEAETIRAPASLPPEEPSRPSTLTMLGKVAPVQTTEQEAVAQAVARVEMALAVPQSMLVRGPQTREQNSVVCLEVNSRDRSGSYTGFVPVIVTPRQVLFHRSIGESRDVAGISASLDFNRLNERYRCW